MRSIIITKIKNGYTVYVGCETEFIKTGEEVVTYVKKLIKTLKS